MLRGLLRARAVVVFGSWARGGGGEWSDVDILVVSDDVKRVPILERFMVSAMLRRHRVDVFVYTLDELEKMVERGNPLALSALIEGLVLEADEDVKRVIEKARRLYKRVGRAWIRVTTDNS